MRDLVGQTMTILWWLVQLEGVRWFWDRQQDGLGGILADDMGLGKVYPTLNHILLPIYPVVVVTLQ